MNTQRNVNKRSIRLIIAIIVIIKIIISVALFTCNLIELVAEWLRVRLRVRMVRGSTLTVGNFLSLENLNVIIRAIN